MGFLSKKKKKREGATVASKGLVMSHFYSPAIECGDDSPKIALQPFCKQDLEGMCERRPDDVG